MFHTDSLFRSNYMYHLLFRVLIHVVKYNFYINLEAEFIRLYNKISLKCNPLKRIKLTTKYNFQNRLEPITAMNKTRVKQKFLNHMR